MNKFELILIIIGIILIVFAQFMGYEDGIYEAADGSGTCGPLVEHNGIGDIIMDQRTGRFHTYYLTTLIHVEDCK